MENRWVRACVSALEVLIAACLALMAVLVFGNVVLRYAFNSGIAMSEELSRLLFVWLIFLGAILASVQHAHIGFDSLVQRLPLAVRKALVQRGHVGPHLGGDGRERLFHHHDGHPLDGSGRLVARAHVGREARDGAPNRLGPDQLGSDVPETAGKRSRDAGGCVRHAAEHSARPAQPAVFWQVPVLGCFT